MNKTEKELLKASRECEKTWTPKMKRASDKRIKQFNKEMKKKVLTEILFGKHEAT